VRDYNEDKLKALLVSSAGGEGLDLKGTRLVQMLDPHWNNEKLRQVEGRAIRYKSHDHLPEEERNVTINNYLATRPRKGILESLHISDPGLGADQYLTRRSGEKDKLIDQFKGLLPNSKKS
jgi:superfamily II DNA/RNA helicase